MDQRLAYLFRGLSAVKWEYDRFYLLTADGKEEIIYKREFSRFHRYEVFFPCIPYTHYYISRNRAASTTVCLICYDDPRNPDYIIALYLGIRHIDTWSDNHHLEWCHRNSPEGLKLAKLEVQEIPREYRVAFDIPVLHVDREKDKRE